MAPELAGLIRAALGRMTRTGTKLYWTTVAYTMTMALVITAVPDAWPVGLITLPILLTVTVPASGADPLDDARKLFRRSIRSMLALYGAFGIAAGLSMPLLLFLALFRLPSYDPILSLLSPQISYAGSVTDPATLVLLLYYLVSGVSAFCGISVLLYAPVAALREQEVFQPIGAVFSLLRSAPGTLVPVQLMSLAILCALQVGGQHAIRPLAGLPLPGPVPWVAGAVISGLYVGTGLALVINLQLELHERLEQ